MHQIDYLLKLVKEKIRNLKDKHKRAIEKIEVDFVFWMVKEENSFEAAAELERRRKQALADQKKIFGKAVKELEELHDALDERRKKMLKEFKKGE